MRKIVLLIMAFAILKTQAQNYQITFTGTVLATSVDSVLVKNLNQETEIRLSGNDTLHLSGTDMVFENPRINDQLDVYPNPMQEQTSVSFNVKKTGLVKFRIVDFSGKVIFQDNQMMSNGIQKCQIANLKKGVYSLSIVGETYAYASKLICMNSSMSEPKINFAGYEKAEKFHDETNLSNNSKNTKSIIQWPYSTGNTLRFIGYSGTYIDTLTDVPSSSKTMTFVFEEPPLFIGDTLQGGIIAYILVPGDTGYVPGENHGLIVAPSDQSSGIFWHASFDGITGATATAIGSGNNNTNLILALYGTENNAAKLCADLELGGYNDWYLPSKDELNMIYLNKDIIGGLTVDTYAYWSSSEHASGSAWLQGFGSGGVQVFDGKAYPRLVRAVRSF